MKRIDPRNKAIASQWFNTAYDIRNASFANCMDQLTWFMFPNMIPDKYIYNAFAFDFEPEPTIDAKIKKL